MNIENLFLTTLDTLPFPAFYKDAELRYQGCNNIFAVEIIGMAKESIVGKKIDDFMTEIPADLAMKYHLQDERLLENHGKQIYDSDVLCNDGIRRKFRFVKSAVTNDKGEVEGIFGMMIDLEGTTRSSKILSHRRHFEELGKKAAFLVHEINAPLMKMKAILKKNELLANAFENEELINLTNDLLETHKTLTNISNWVKSMGHESYQIESRKVPVLELVHKTEDLVTNSLMESGVEFNFPCETEITDITLNCKPVQLTQLLFNIMKNSSEAVGHKNEKWVSLEIAKEEAYVDFTVADSGDGISSELRDKILSGGQTTKSIGKGLGVGLQIVQEILKDHKGELIISPEGEPTRITTRFFI
jgi:PAS domain S-box-containing protein